jgi:N utilization substance protein A
MDIEIMTHDELGEALERAERWFGQLPHVTPEVIQALIEEGFLSYNEITFIDGEELLKFAPGLTEEQANELVEYAEEYADHMDRAAEEERRAAEEAAAQAAAEAEAAAAAEAEANAGAEGVSAEGGDGATVAVADIDGDGTPDAAVAMGEPPPRRADFNYHEGMPTDTQGVEEAVIHEEQRTGEDGELTTTQADEDSETKGGASA